jgi:hypothetical protein
MTELCQGPDPRPRRPRLAVPTGAIDAHFHLFGPASRYPMVDAREYTPPPVRRASTMSAWSGRTRDCSRLPSRRCCGCCGKAIGSSFRAVTGYRSTSCLIAISSPTCRRWLPRARIGSCGESFVKSAMPNTTDLLDLLADWVPDEVTRRRILVDNAAKLYRF